MDYVSQAGIARLGNAVAESFWHTLKNELIHRHQFPTRDQVCSAIFEYIEVFYNRTRRHTSIGNISPVDFELQRAKADKPPIRGIGGRSVAVTCAACEPPSGEVGLGRKPPLAFQHECGTRETGKTHRTPDFCPRCDRSASTKPNRSRIAATSS